MRKTFEFYGKSIVTEDISSTNTRHTRFFSIGSTIYTIIIIIAFIGMVILGIQEDAGVKFYVIIMGIIIGSMYIHNLFAAGRVVEITLRNGNTFKSDKLSIEDAELLKTEILRKVNN